MSTHMISEWMDRARRGEPVWLGDVRESFERLEERVPVMLQFTAFSGERRDFSIPLPRWEREQESFVEEYARACLFNALSVFSAASAVLYVDFAQTQALDLLRRLPDAFQVNAPRPTGYGKVVQIARRLQRTFHSGEFRMAIEDMPGYVPAPPLPRSEDGTLRDRLDRAVRRAERGLYCGVDIGGTDIKLALAKDGTLLAVEVLDWDPAGSPTAAGIIDPIRSLIRSALDRCAPGALLDGLGISFPDVVIRDRIVGGETPKTRGMRDNPDIDYETEFGALTDLCGTLAALCRPGAPIHMVNDGHMAAFTACVELSHGGEELSDGILAHSLGTDLGTGWVEADGSIPEYPLELYDLLLDLGSAPARAAAPKDLRSVRNENSGLPGLRRYTGQAAAFRLAWELEPELLRDFTVRRGDIVAIQDAPDLRKPCLEHLMSLAQEGDSAAEKVFRQIGVHLGQVSRELETLAHPAARTRYIFGRFVKKPRCFALLQEGCGSVCPQVTLRCADEELASTPLMRALAERGPGMVAQYSQTVGAIYFALRT